MLTVIRSATTATMASATVTIMPSVTAEVSQSFYVYKKLSMVDICNAKLRICIQYYCMHNGGNVFSIIDRNDICYTYSNFYNPGPGQLLSSGIVSDNANQNLRVEIIVVITKEIRQLQLCNYSLYCHDVLMNGLPSIPPNLQE